MWYASGLIHQAAVRPESVARVCDGQVADAEPIEHSQNAQTGADRMAALHSN